MPRPCKRRRVCAMPTCHRFGPTDASPADAVVMTVDEFEAIRLIDLENLTQEACANRMNVARATVQAIYSSARTKLAECLVQGYELHIVGGDVDVCESSKHGCGRGGCRCRHTSEQTTGGTTS